MIAVEAVGTESQGFVAALCLSFVAMRIRSPSRPCRRPPGIAGIAGFSFGTSATIASVVTRRPAIEAARSCAANGRLSKARQDPDCRGRSMRRAAFLRRAARGPATSIKGKGKKPQTENAPELNDLALRGSPLQHPLATAIYATAERLIANGVEAAEP
jgi:hypothetical protein